jgi:hypothetical protein
MSISYNGSFPENVALPFVTISDEPIYYGEKWGVVENVSLSGIITGCNEIELVSRRTAVLTLFLKDYKTLNIDDGKFIRNNVIVQSVNFEDSNHLGSIGFEVNLICYPEDYFLFSGVIDAVNEWTYEETDDSTVIINHNIQATGLKTDNISGIQNAKNFIDSKKKITAQVDLLSAQFVKIPNGRSAFLITEKESVDRLNGSVSLSRTYIVDALNSHNGVFRYLINKEEMLSDFIKVSVSGSYSGGIEANFADMRNEISGINFLEIAETAHSNLNVTPLEASFTESEDQKTIGFSFSYDNNPDGNVSLSTSVDMESQDDGSFIINLSGRVFGRGHLKKRYEDIKGYFAGLNLLELAESAATSFDPTISLNKNFQNYSHQKNEFTGEISFSASFNDKKEPPVAFDQLSYSITVRPSIQKVSYNNVVNKKDKIFEFWNLDYYTRGNVSISGSGTVKEGFSVQDAISSLTFEINSALGLYFEYVSILKESDSSGFSLNGQNINFSLDWSFETKGPINSTSSDLSRVSSLI